MLWVSTPVTDQFVARVDSRGRLAAPHLLPWFQTAPRRSRLRTQ